ncbi:MAG: hypothetical protein HDQ99_20990 [Lachnospiraceae bacterium]|nr:hypothetical protein [Lachnospiraceae bacterium]
MRLQSQYLQLPSKADIYLPEFRDKSIESNKDIHAFGKYGNVYLSDVQLSELQSEIPTFWEQYIELLSEDMEST